MKKWFLFSFVLLAVSGCGDIQWFPSATQTTDTSNSTSNTTATVSNTVFVNRCGVSPSSLITSNAILLANLSGLTTISISGGNISEYSINDGLFTGIAGIVGNGQTVMVRHTSAGVGAASSVVTSTLNIGSTVYTFKSDTSACPAGSNTF